MAERIFEKGEPYKSVISGINSARGKSDGESAAQCGDRLSSLFTLRAGNNARTA